MAERSGGLRLVSWLGVLTATSLLQAAPAPVTLESLLEEMTNHAVRARWSDPAYRAIEATSHDRSKSNPAADSWHSNKDYEQFIRVEKNSGRQEWVIMEHEGPGAVTRIWLPLEPSRDKQFIRFYFDGSTTPTIEVNFNDFLSGRAFARAPFAFVAWDETDLRKQLETTPNPIRGVGGDLYLPIPFASSCKVTLDQVPFYYHVQYRAYEPGTIVQTFTMAEFQAAKPILEQTARRLADVPTLAASGSGKSATLAPGDALPLDLPNGAAALDGLQVVIDPKDAPEAMRKLVLTASFDEEACVWCPIGDFFGSGPRLRPVGDAFRAVSADGTLTANWVMPFERSARLALRNVGDKPLAVKLAATTTSWSWDDRSLHFHATWHSQRDVSTRPMSDWNFIQISGRGVFVGDTLSVYSPSPAWYGEGDERIYVDGEAFPSHLGTGTEDYYGYAWGMADFFSSPFVSMPRRDIANRNDWRGYTSTSRLRLIDDIPFTKSIRHDMEIWHWADTRVDYAAATFWYARPDAKSNREPQPDEATAALRPPPPDPHATLPGAIECETLAVADHSAGLRFEKQDVTFVTSRHWSGGEQLFVRAERNGDFLTLKIPVPDAHPRKLILHATRSYDYGVLRFSVNGKPAGKEFDGYAADAAPSGPIELGTFEPTDGALMLRVEVEGANPASKGTGRLFGLDCVVLSPAP